MNIIFCDEDIDGFITFYMDKKSAVKDGFYSRYKDGVYFIINKNTIIAEREGF